MAVACSIFTLGGQVQMFWTAFNHGHTLMLHLHDYFFETPKNKICLYPNATYNGTPVTGISKAVQNN